MNKLKSYTIAQLFNKDIEHNFNETYYRNEVDYLINELSNIIFSLEQAVIKDPKWGRILRKDIKKIQQLRKKGIISSKYINYENNKD